MGDITPEHESDSPTDNELDESNGQTRTQIVPTVNISPPSSPTRPHPPVKEDDTDAHDHDSTDKSSNDVLDLPQRAVSSTITSSHRSSADDAVPEMKKFHGPNNPVARARSNVVIDEDVLEREVRDILSGKYIQRQIRASICSVPGDVDSNATIDIHRKRSVFMKKMPFSEKLKKSKNPKEHKLKFFEVFKFADGLDVLLMLIGILAALANGATYSIMLVIYKQVLNNLSNNTVASNTTLFNRSSECKTDFVNVTHPVSPTEAMKSIINYYVLLGFGSILFSYLSSVTWLTAAERQVRRVRFSLFRNILRQEIGWFDERNAGELSNRLVDDLDRIKDGIGEKVPDFITLLSQMLSSLILAFAEGWKLSLVYMAMSPLTMITFNFTIKTIVTFTVKEVKAFAVSSAIAQEVLQNIRTVTAFHGQEKEEKRFADSLIAAKTTGIRKGFYMGLCQGLSTLFNYSATALTLWYGLQLTRTDCEHYSSGSAFVVLFACMSATSGISQLLPNIQSFAEAAGSSVYVFDLIERCSFIDAFADSGEKPDTINGDIEFENVTFAYPTRLEAPILRKLSLLIPSGKTVALVGSSGCGKSTAIQLIQRFYDPESGRILLDGRNIIRLNVTWLRSQIGVVSQEPVLFTGSIEDNIRYGKVDATDEEVEAAAKMANAHDFIMALPEKYKTPSGDKLSGGQKQRVAIARALISNPKILLLDEATSALDNTSERIVQDALDKAKDGRTTIVIAHRLSTIRNADLIVALENGQVRESGTHHELMKQRGLYYGLVTTQSKKEQQQEKQKDGSDSESEDNETKDDNASVQNSLASRRASKQSMNSTGTSEGYNEAIQERTIEMSKIKKFFRVPFLLQIAKFNRPEWYWISLGTLVSLGSGTVQPFYGYVFASLYDTVNEPDPDEQDRLIRVYAIICFCIGLGACITQFLSSFSFAKSGEALTMRMRTITFGAMIRQEMSFFDQEENSVGALVTRLSSDASALKGLTGIRIGTILQSISAGIVGLTLGFTISWKITLVCLSFSPIVFLSGKLRSQIKDTKGKNQVTFVEKGSQYATQAIEHIRTVVSLHQENHFINLYEDAFNQDLKQKFRRAHLLSLGNAITGSLSYFMQCACFGYGSKLIEAGELQFGAVYRAFCVITLCIFAVNRSLRMLPDYAKAKAAGLRIIKLHQRQSQIDPTNESGIILKDIGGNIEFSDVHFRYPNRPTLRVLRHFSLKCLYGATTALVGPSGCGKSTAIALLQRFYDPDKGRILIDGHDIKVFNIRWWRSMIGLVQQEPILFNLSIRDNIAYGDNSRDIKQEEIETAARMANIHELIISFPHGYETLCGAKGSQLSGGQKQRIAIARALIRNPKLLLLDEATSALDNKSEKVVQATLDQARSGRTCITIAHRLSTIRNSEKIAVVNRGKLREEGTHEELLHQKGIYAQLALSQRKSGHH
ncbi:unnamed protein product [Adineta ricciae]|uniref:Uncharacterized protein n=1 Tax=Adineta ricciae TaxID=249248 RepID=A0A815UYJ5_ADIRI|nr:unnamed protein product [Adineta ricciae]